MLLGHSIGLSDSYYKPTEKEMLTEYLKVVDALTINYENRLSKQVQELKEKDDYQKYVIDKKIHEKDEQIKLLVSQVEKLSTENNRNRQAFIDIAKQIQEINIRTKIDSDTRKRLKSADEKERRDETLSYFSK
jgi:hypothetical protein